MDPLSQGVVGTTFALAGVSKKRTPEIKTAFWLGWLSGMAPDLDVFIRSKTDPLLFLEYHRHFTHSFAFIPIGALVCALVLGPIFARLGTRLSWSRVYLYCFLGYASHGLLDACTSYGTQLYWPFSNFRVAWDVISIIDPLFTFPILTLLILALRKRSLRISRMALVYGLAYMALGFYQHSRAIDVLSAKAQERGHLPTRVHAKPSFGNMLVYRGIYETQDRFYVDAVRVTPISAARIIEGASLPKFKMAEHPEIKVPSQLSRDIERFAWFSDQFLVWHPRKENFLTDFRYSTLPDSTEDFLWGISVDATQPDNHVSYETIRETSSDVWSRFWTMLKGS